MKKRKNELDVDFIGDGRSLTKDEEKAISEFIKASKERNKKQHALKPERLYGKRLTDNQCLLCVTEARTANSVFIKLWLECVTNEKNLIFSMLYRR